MKLPCLNRLLYLDDPVRAADGAGGFTQSWHELGALWCEVSLQSGNDGRLADAAVSAVRQKVITRAAPQGHPQRPKAGQRFRDETRIYTIRAVSEHPGPGAYLLCFVEEETAI